MLARLSGFRYSRCARAVCPSYNHESPIKENQSRGCCGDATACRESSVVVTSVGRRMVRKGWPTRNVYTRGSDERNGEIAGSPSGSKVTYVFPLFASSTCCGERRAAAKHTCPGLRDRTLYSRRGTHSLIPGVT